MALLTLMVLWACDGDHEPSDPDGADDDTSVSDDDSAADDDDTTATDDDSAAALHVTDLVVVEHVPNVLAYHAAWTTSALVASDLYVDCGPVHSEHLSGDTPRTDHRAFLMGLVAGAECLLTVQPDADATGDTTETFTVGPIPEIFPEISMDVADAGGAYPGWTLLNLTHEVEQIPLKIVVVDLEGRIRWYYELDQAQAYEGSDNSLVVLDEGILIGGTRGEVWPMVVDWQSNVVWREEIYVHHEMLPDQGDPDRLLFLGDTAPCGGGVQASSVLGLWDRQEAEVSWAWCLSDHYEPQVELEDWDHLNAIEPFPGEDALLLSARGPSALFKMDRSSGEIVWMMRAGGDFDMPADAVFDHQHAPEIQPDGNILLFDNQSNPQTSRVIELSYDDVAMTVELVWEFYPSPDIPCDVWGDADRQPNGNTLMTFGRHHHDETTHVIEADANADEVWHISFPPAWGVYRADRVPPLRSFFLAEE